MGHVYEDYINDALREGWTRDGMEYAIAETRRLCPFFPHYAELEAAYLEWQEKAAQAAAAEPRRDLVTLPAGLVDPGTGEIVHPAAEERRKIRREYAERYMGLQSNPAAFRAHMERRRAIRGAAEAAGIPYLTELDERLQEAGVLPDYEECRNRLAMRSRYTVLCSDCQDLGWRINRDLPLGHDDRMYKCRCGAADRTTTTRR